MADSKKKEAEAALKEADKITTKSFTRWKCDWDNGAILYEKAAKGFRTAKQFDQAIYCFKRLSLCQTNQDVYYLAAKSIESAAMMEKEQNHLKEAVELLVESSKLYRTNGNSFAAADAMTRAAKMIEEKDVDQALQLLHDACELFELDDKEHFSGDAFKMTISMLLRHKKIFECIDLLIIQNRVFSKLDQTNELNKSCLSVIVLHLDMDDNVMAKKRYEDFLQYVQWAHSNEGKVAGQLIQAFDANDAEAVKKLSQQYLFNFLDNQVAKIAKNLSLGGVSGGKEAEESVL
ncbi:soluble NSF attachment protein gamma isoform [Cavenderia fasciculata]|uniref:Gamma-soluble NSF attachment protein n=1 Tax=Cavenderia fasciculata TaxID=261658 RepID=F4PW53_CACFS|nr:soluble NSF attachment protein gamma isoform [Cavenderia fasciculata]EGG20217.1 soluble NSF attachment protein gamma isoform [Cavenderia fasciculata]|eukprot:XP_004367200.1 soluble NSF attachment protein gamma isoform [Cavenderia fasciculata]